MEGWEMGNADGGGDWEPQQEPGDREDPWDFS